MGKTKKTMVWGFSADHVIRSFDPEPAVGFSWA